MREGGERGQAAEAAHASACEALAIRWQAAHVPAKWAPTKGHPCGMKRKASTAQRAGRTRTQQGQAAQPTCSATASALRPRIHIQWPTRCAWMACSDGMGECTSG